MITQSSTRLSVSLIFAGLLASFLCCPAALAQGKKKAAKEIPVKAIPAKGGSANADPAEAAKEADDAQAKVKVERGAGGKKVYKIEG